MVAVDCYTLRGRCVCVFGVKFGDLCGSEGVNAKGADWHSDVGINEGKRETIHCWKCWFWKIHFF